MVRAIQYALAVLVVVLAAAGAIALVFTRYEVTTNKLVILSPNPEPVKIEFAQAFCKHIKQEWNEDVQIEWLNTGGGTQDQLRYIKTQFQKSPNGIGLDVFWGGGIDPYCDLKNEGLLQPYDPPQYVLEAIPPTCAGIPLYDPDKQWYGTALSGFGIVYNKPVIQKMGLRMPKAWEDLADPRLVGLVACGDPRQSGVAHMLIEIILQAYGWAKGFEIVTQICANIRSFSDSSAMVATSVGLGECLYGMTIDFYAWSQIAKDGPERVGFVMPQGLTVVTPDAIAILKGAPHLNLAQRFVNFVLSEKGQLLWIMPVGAPGGPTRHGLNRISVMPAVHKLCQGKCTVPTTPLDFTAQMNYDSKKGAIRWGVLNDLIGAFMIDTHEELVAAWKAVIARKLPPDEVKRLCAAPISEDEAIQLAQTRWADSAFRSKKIARWIDEARKRYRELTKQP